MLENPTPPFSDCSWDDCGKALGASPAFHLFSQLFLPLFSCFVNAVIVVVIWSPHLLFLYSIDHLIHPCVSRACIALHVHSFNTALFYTLRLPISPFSIPPLFSTFSGRTLGSFGFASELGAGPHTTLHFKSTTSTPF